VFGSGCLCIFRCHRCPPLLTIPRFSFLLILFLYLTCSLYLGSRIALTEDSEGADADTQASAAEAAAHAQAQQEAREGYRALVSMIATVMAEYTKSILAAFQGFLKK
jgi:hypothetical protein